ncbi:MAG: tetratricopeptide repeat protein [Planctomycetes bacterium]|nr:tetratricopeptide repeat protein [Planctomycetota bacterium]
MSTPPPLDAPPAGTPPPPGAPPPGTPSPPPRTAHNLPHPLAVHVARAASAEEPATRLEATLRAAEALHRHATLVAAACYLDSPEAATDEELSRALDGLLRGTPGVSQTFLSLFCERFEVEGPFAGAVRSFHDGAEVEKRMEVREIVDRKERVRKIGHLTQVLDLRSDLPKNLSQIPRAKLAESAAFAGMLLDGILEAARALISLALVHLEDRGPLGPGALTLEGAGPFSYQSLSLAGDPELGRVHLVERASGRALSLHPFVLHHDCYYCLREKEVGAEARSGREVFYLERTSAERVHYRGPRHSVALKEFRSALADRLAPKRAARAPAAAAGPQGWAEAVNARTLEELDRTAKASGAAPEVFVPRRQALAHIERFLAERGTSLLVLVGERGIGKTALLSRAAAEWIQRGYAVHYCPADAREKPDPAAEFEGLFPGPVERASLLAELAKGGPARAVLVVDGLDRTQDALAAAEGLRKMLDGLPDLSTGVKVILALRDVFHIEGVEEGLAGLLALSGSRTYRVRTRTLSGEEEVPWVRLERMDAAESEACYEALRRQPGARPHTEFHELRRSPRELLAHPGFARVIALAYHDRDVPSHLTLETLLDQYSLKALFLTRERREFLDSLVEALYRARAEWLSADRLIDSGEENLSRQVVESDPRSAYVGLVADGVLARRLASGPTSEVEWIGFPSVPLFDYLVYRFLHKRYEGSDDLLVELARAPGRFLFEGALRHLFLKRIGTAGSSDLGRVLERGGRRMERLLADVLLHIDDHAESNPAEPESGPFARTSARLLEAAGTAAVACLERVADRLFQTCQFEECARLYDRLAERADAAGEEAGDLWARAAQAALSADDLKAAHRRFKRVVKILRRASPGRPTERLARAHVALGEIELREKSPKKALDWFEKALAEIGADEALGLAVHRRRAEILAQLRDWGAARSDLESAAEAALRIGNRQALGEILVQRGELELAAGSREAAESFFERAAGIAREAGDPAARAAAVGRLARFHRDSGRREEALGAATEALAACESLGRSPELAALHCQVGQDLEALDRREEAFDHYRAARAISEGLKDAAGLAAALHRLGALYYSDGNFHRALDHYVQALDHWKRIGDRGQIGHIYHNVGMVQQALGDNAKALEYYKRAMDIKGELGDVAGQARTMNHVARIHGTWKEFELAFQHLDRAVEILHREKDLAGMATSYNYRGQILFEMEKFQEALAAYSKSAQILEQAGDKKGLAACYNNIALVYKARADFYEALKSFGKAAALQEEAGDRRGLAATYNNMGVVYDSRGDYENALSYYEKDLDISKSLGDRRGAATSYNNIAILHFNHRQYAKALNSLEECRSLARDLKDHELEERTLEKIRMVKERM